MKHLSSLLIILFITFQFSTSFIYFVDNFNNNNIAIEILDEEEEDSKELKEYKELKSDFLQNNKIYFNFLSDLKSSRLISFYLIKKYKVATSITILPPENV